MKYHQDWITYSSAENLVRTQRLNSYLYDQVYNTPLETPSEALRDFNRNKYFLNKAYDTRGRSEAVQEKIINRFLSKGTLTEEQQALAKLLKARGGQAFSADLSMEIKDYCEAHQPKIKYTASGTMEISIYTPSTRSTSSIQRLDIQLNYFGMLGTSFKAMDGTTGQLKDIDDEGRRQIWDKISDIQSKLLDLDEGDYRTIQQKLSSDESSLIIAKIIEKVIYEKLGLLPITFAASKRIFTGIHPNDFVMPLKLFDKSMTLDRLDTRGKVIAQQTEFAMGSNTDEVIINQQFADLNQLSKLPKEKMKDLFLERSINHIQNPEGYLNDDISIKSTFITDFINILKEIIDSLQNIFNNNDNCNIHKG